MINEITKQLESKGVIATPKLIGSIVRISKNTGYSFSDIIEVITDAVNSEPYIMQFILMQEDTNMYNGSINFVNNLGGNQYEKTKC